MKHFIGWAAVIGAAIPLLAYAFVSLINPMPPLPFMNVLQVLCPGWIMFMITAACEPLDACSMKVLSWVVTSNVALYGFLGFIAWCIRRASHKAVLR